MLFDAISILSSMSISVEELETAKHLLNRFVVLFEREYTESNVVFNVHLLSHLAQCVEMNGPTFCYTNYCMEDNMGHLLSFVSGTNDVIMQISEKYLMERNLIHNLVNNSVSRNYYEAIQARQRFPLSRKIGKSQIIGKRVNRCALSIEEINYIRISLDLHPDIEIQEYQAVLLDGETFYESASHKSRRSKRTYDGFVSLPELGIYGEIKSIFIANEQLYMFVHNTYESAGRTTLTGQFLTWLNKRNQTDFFIVDPVHHRMEKYVFLQSENKFACVKIVNSLERN